jgi:acetyl esterase/lipase
VTAASKAPPRRRRWLRRIGLTLLTLSVLVGAAVAWKPSRVTLQTLLLVPSLVDAGPQPLELFAPGPHRESVPYRLDPAAAADLADLWLPAGASAQHRVGGMVLVLGVNNVGRSYPAVVRFADAMARSGVAVLVPDSAALLAGSLTPDETAGVVDAFRLLATRPEVDPQRVGLVGLSVGGSLALLAAGDPRIASQVRWVDAFGAYADAGEYLAEVAAQQQTIDGRVVPWDASGLTRQTFSRLVEKLIPDAADRASVGAAIQAFITGGRLPTLDPAFAASLSSPEARAIYALLTAGSLDSARAVVAALPTPVRDLLGALSPIRHLEAIRADVFLMYDTADSYVPYGQSLELAAGLRPLGRLARSSEFRLFDHVEPKGVDLVGAAPELWKLLWHVQAVLMETL